MDTGNKTNPNIKPGEKRGYRLRAREERWRRGVLLPRIANSDELSLSGVLRTPAGGGYRILRRMRLAED